MYVSDFTKGKIWRMTRDNRFQVIAEYLPAPADIGIDRANNLILVPYHYTHATEMNGLESPTEAKPKAEKRTLADYGFIPPPPKTGPSRNEEMSPVPIVTTERANAPAGPMED